MENKELKFMLGKINTFDVKNKVSSNAYIEWIEINVINNGDIIYIYENSECIMTFKEEMMKAIVNTMSMFPLVDIMKWYMSEKYGLDITISTYSYTNYHIMEERGCY